MRFGVKDENTLDHLTWISCVRFRLETTIYYILILMLQTLLFVYRGINWCKRESSGIFFLSLQSEK